MKFGIERESRIPGAAPQGPAPTSADLFSARAGNMNPAATPFLSAPPTTVPKAELWKSPGGSDYIVTPGRHRIDMNDFISSFDADVVAGANPRMAAVQNYAENMYQEWLLSEKKLDAEVFALSYPVDSPMEKFRQMAVQSVFTYAVSHNLHEKTIHLCLLNVNRLILDRVKHREKELTSEIFASTVITALRHAVKVEECWEKAERFRFDPLHVWRSAVYMSEVVPDKSVKRLNDLESQSLKVLVDPPNPPCAPEFLERYVAVGNWPMYKEAYIELGSFLLGMALFAQGLDNPLKGMPNSKLAAAALALAVKVINTDACFEKFEFWPERLVTYTGFTIEDLKPGIRGLAQLLRNKPERSRVLERYYTKWGLFDWN